MKSIDDMEPCSSRVRDSSSRRCPSFPMLFHGSRYDAHQPAHQLTAIGCIVVQDTAADGQIQ